MSERLKKALTSHQKGYNCSQAVACAYCDLFGIDEKTVFMMSEGFGSGMGGLMETCGALTGMFMLVGLQNSSGDVENPKTKGATYKIVKSLAETFEEKNKSIICRDLKGLTGGKMLRSCGGCIEDACMIFEDYLNSIEKQTESVL